MTDEKDNDAKPVGLAFDMTRLPPAPCCGFIGFASTTTRAYSVKSIFPQIRYELRDEYCTGCYEPQATKMDPIAPNNLYGVVLSYILVKCWNMNEKVHPVIGFIVFKTLIPLLIGAALGFLL